MAKKTKKGGQDINILPAYIELICKATGQVKEFDTIHAQRILGIQLASKLGSYTIFNTELYNYDEGSRSIKQNVRQSESSEGDTVTQED
jgi:hypothetical protein